MLRSQHVDSHRPGRKYGKARVQFIRKEDERVVLSAQTDQGPLSS